jgi:hypothetical protein
MSSVPACLLSCGYWTFHTDGLSGTTLSGTYIANPSNFDRIAVSYDPVNRIATPTRCPHRSPHRQHRRTPGSEVEQPHRRPERQETPTVSALGP